MKTVQIDDETQAIVTDEFLDLFNVAFEALKNGHSIGMCFDLMKSAKAEMRNFPMPESAPQEQAAQSESWRCYHCGEVFTDHDAAREHFGVTQYKDPACQIDIAKYREMEETLRRFHNEDTDLHREIHALHTEKTTAVRRAEEQGYAKGIEDAKKYPGELGLMLIPKQAAQDGIKAMRAERDKWKALYDAAIKLNESQEKRFEREINLLNTEQAVAVPGWLPIESAPKDDVHVRGMWVHGPGKHGTHDPLYFAQHVGHVDDAGYFVDDAGNEYGWRPEHYTHWTPFIVPQPPKVE